MRKINQKLAVVLVAVIAVAAVGVYFLHSFQLRRNARIFLDRAQKSRAEGKFDVALRNYQWYTQLIPEDIDALGEFADLLVELKAYGAAFPRLEAILRRDPDRTEARRQLVTILLAMGRFRDAQEHLEQYLLRAKPDDPELLYDLGRCQRGLAQFEQASSTFRRVIELKPDYVAAYGQLAGLYRYDLKNPQQGDEWIQKLLAKAGDSLEAMQTAAVYFYQVGDYTSAYKWAEQAIGKDDQDVDMLVVAADSARRLEQWDKAQQLAEKAVALSPKRADVVSLLATVVAARGNQQQAIKILQNALEKVNDKAAILWTLANMCLDAGDLATAEKTIQQLEKQAGAKARAELLRGRLLVQQQQWFQAKRKLEAVRPDVTNSPELLRQVDLLLGICSAQLGNLDESLSAYSRAVDQDPLSPQARLGRATAYLELGRLEEAINDYRSLLQIGKASPQTLLELARLLILSNLGKPREQRNWAEAQQLLEALQKDQETRPQAVVLKAEILFADNRAAEAEKLLEEAYRQDPRQAAIGLALVSLKQQLGRSDEAQTLLATIQKESGETVETLVLETRLARATSDVEQAKKVLADVAERGKKLPSADYQRLLSHLVTLALQLGDYANARKWTEELSQLSPNNLRVRLLLFDLAIQAQDVQGLSRVLDEIARIEGKGPLWQYGEAVRLFLESKGENRALLQQALDYLTRAAVARPNWLRIPALQGQIFDLLGDSDLATSAYLRAISLGDRSVTTARRLVQLLYSQQRFLEADRVIRDLERQQTPFSADLERLASNVSLQLADYERAMDLARRAAANSQDYRDHVWYATVQSVLGLRYLAEGRQQEAEKLLASAEEEFRQGITLAPEAVDALVAQVQFYARTGQTQKAEQAIAEAQKRIKGGIAPLAMGQVYEVLGQDEKAEQYYREALAASPNDPAIVRQVAEFYLRTGRAESARLQLERITSGQIQAPENDVVWGRRSMAILLAAQGGYENLQKGLELVSKNRISGQPVSIQDLRAEALLLSAHPLRKRRLEGRQLLEKVVKEMPQATADDRFILAQLYMADGDTVNAARHMRALLASSGDEPRYVTPYVSFLIEQNQLAEADVWLTRLEKLAPQAFSTVSLRARLLALQNRHDEAIRLLREFAEKEAETPASAATTPVSAGTGNTPSQPSSDQTGEDAASRIQQLRWALAGDALESLGRYCDRTGNKQQAAQYYDQAEQLYRRFVEKNPEATVLLASFLGRRGNIQEALDLLERSWDKADLALIRAATGVFLGLAYTHPEQAERIEKLVLQALDKFQRPISLLQPLADFYGIQGRIEDSQAIYREILKRDEKNIVALNNLAAMLALQGKNLDEAAKLIQRAIAIAGPGANLLDSQALVLLAQKRPQEALKILAQAIEDQPLAILFFHQAQAYQALNQRQAAAESFQKALQLGLRREAVHPLERPLFDSLQALVPKGTASQPS